MGCGWTGWNGWEGGRLTSARGGRGALRWGIIHVWRRAVRLGEATATTSRGLGDGDGGWVVMGLMRVMDDVGDAIPTRNDVSADGHDAQPSNGWMEGQRVVRGLTTAAISALTRPLLKCPTTGND